MADPNELLDEAARTPFRGWDFSALGDRLRLEPPPWSFSEIVEGLMASANAMLDMGTGGGEWLASLQKRPGRVAATESWTPNVPIAAEKLRPLGIVLVQDEGAVDNVAQRHGSSGGSLPFRDRCFDLVTNRHESFVAEEIYRVVEDGGAFVTQQATSGSTTFHELLNLEAPVVEDFSLPLAVAQLTRAGFRIEKSGEGVATTVFGDVGALAWYLTNVPWAVPGFTVDRYREELRALHGAAIPVSSSRFWLLART